MKIKVNACDAKTALLAAIEMIEERELHDAAAGPITIYCPFRKTKSMISDEESVLISILDREGLSPEDDIRIYLVKEARSAVTRHESRLEKLKSEQESAARRINTAEKHNFTTKSEWKTKREEINRTLASEEAFASSLKEIKYSLDTGNFNIKSHPCEEGLMRCLVIAGQKYDYFLPHGAYWFKKIQKNCELDNNAYAIFKPRAINGADKIVIEEQDHAYQTNYKK